MWIDYIFKPLAVLLGYALKSDIERMREIERRADARARRKFNR